MILDMLIFFSLQHCQFFFFFHFFRYPLFRCIYIQDYGLLLMNCPFYHYEIFLCLVIFLILKSVLFYINVAIPAFLYILVSCCIFFLLFTFTLSMFLYLKMYGFFCREHVVGSCCVKIYLSLKIYLSWNVLYIYI